MKRYFILAIILVSCSPKQKTVELKNDYQNFKNLKIQIQFTQGKIEEINKQSNLVNSHIQKHNQVLINHKNRTFPTPVDISKLKFEENQSTTVAPERI
jgi:hypothetical protein